MSLTGFARHFFQPRQKELERHINEGPALQREVLETLISEAQDTEYGRKCMFSHIKGYEDFVRNVREKASGAKVLEGLNPAQQIVSIVNDELTAMMGESAVCV